MGPSHVAMERANASHDRIRAISWTKDLTSWAFADLERSWLSLACSDGCCEMRTLPGSEAMACGWRVGGGKAAGRAGGTVRL